jgi:uncharacterized coiled-coil protein SlyX
MRKPPQKKQPTLSERLKRLEKIVKKQDQKIKELELEIKRLDLDEITQVNDKMHRPSV